MNKRLKFLIASILSTGVFLGVFFIPGYIYPKQIVYSLFFVICFWLGIGLPTKLSEIRDKLGFLILPTMFTFGFYQLSVLFDKNIFWGIVFALFSMFITYIFFLIYNIFNITTRQKTPALFTSANTVSLLLSLFTSFLVWNFLWSLRQIYYINLVLFFVAGVGLFLHYVWVVVLDDRHEVGKGALVTYILVPSLIIAELSVVLSFWPGGQFVGSLYVSIATYILSQLVLLGVQDKNIEKEYSRMFWIGLAASVAVIFSTRWR